MTVPTKQCLAQLNAQAVGHFHLSRRQTEQAHTRNLLWMTQLRLPAAAGQTETYMVHQSILKSLVLRFDCDDVHCYCRVPPGSSSNAQSTAQNEDGQKPQQVSQQAIQHANTETQTTHAASRQKETQLAAAQKKAAELSAELAEANRLAGDRQTLLQDQQGTMSDASSTPAKQEAELDLQLKAKQASLDALQKRMDSNSKSEDAKVQQLQGISVAKWMVACKHAALRSSYLTYKYGLELPVL